MNMLHTRKYSNVLLFFLQKQFVTKRWRGTKLKERACHHHKQSVNHFNLGSHDLLLGDALIYITHLQANQGLEQTGTVIGAREGAVLQHLLSDFAIELSAGVGKVALHVDELLKLIKLTIHLQHAHLLTIVVVRAIVHLNAGETASELAAAGDPADGRAFIEQEGRVKQLLALLLDETHAQNLTLSLVGYQLSGKYLNNDISLLLLGIDIGIKIGLAGLDGGLDGLQGVATLSHITLDLPGKLDLVRDVEIDAEIHQVVDAVIKEWVQAFNDQDLRGINALRGVQESRNVVVDRLINSLALFQILDLQ